MKRFKRRISGYMALVLTAAMLVTGIDVPVFAAEELDPVPAVQDEIIMSEVSENELSVDTPEAIAEEPADIEPVLSVGAGEDIEEEIAPGEETDPDEILANPEEEESASDECLATPKLGDGEEEKSSALILGSETPHIKGARVSRVYFGNYKQSRNGKGGYNTDPIEWTVLYNNSEDGVLFLLSEKNIDKRWFDSRDDITWAESDMRNWLNGTGDYMAEGSGFIDTAFADEEQAAVVLTALKTGENPKYHTPGGPDTDDKLFLLAVEDVIETAYGFSDKYDFEGGYTRRSRDTDYVADLFYYPSMPSEAYDAWWTRTPGTVKCKLIVTTNPEDPTSSVWAPHQKSYAVRPAFNLNLSSVLFTSIAENGKISNGVSAGRAGSKGLAPIGTTESNEWKVTLLDDGSANAAGNGHAGFSASRKDSGEVAPGESVKISYDNGVEGVKEFVSAILCDASGKPVYYGRIRQLKKKGLIPVEKGNVDITIPEGLADGNYTLKVFCEQYNDDFETDYASAFVDIPVTIKNVAKYNVKFNANGGFGTMPVMERKVGDGLSLPVNEFTYPQRKFEGWNTEKNGSGEAYEDKYKGNILKSGGVLPENGDTVTLYAQWDWGEIPEDIQEDIFGKDMSRVKENSVWYAFKYDGKWHAGTDTLKMKYTGKKLTFTSDIMVFHGFWKLWKDRDYSIKYANNKNAAARTAGKAPGVTIKGKNSYRSNAVFKFDIEPADINGASTGMEKTVAVKTGTKLGSLKPSVKFGSTKLKAGTDYDLLYYEGDPADETKRIASPEKYVIKEGGKDYFIVLAGRKNFTGRKVAVNVKSAGSNDTYVIPVNKVKITDTKGKEIKLKSPYSGEAFDFAGYFDNRGGREPKAQVRSGKRVLEYGTDYSIEAATEGDTLKSAGTHRLMIRGTAAALTEDDIKAGRVSCVGNKTFTVEITGTPLSNVKIAGLNTTVGFRGRQITIEDLFDADDTNLEEGWTGVTLYTVGKDKVKKPLVKSEDEGATGDFILLMPNIGAASYTETYTYPVYRPDGDGGEHIEWVTRKIEKGGKFEVSFRGVNGYTGTITKKVRVRPYDIRETGVAEADKKIKVEIDDSATVFSKSGAKPVVTVSYGGETLREGIDYTLSYKNNRKPAPDLTGLKNKNKPMVTVKGKGNFKGSLSGYYYKIGKADVGRVSLSVSDVEHNVKGKAGYFLSKPALSDGGSRLKAGKNKDVEKIAAADLKYTYADETVLTDGTLMHKDDEVSAGDKIPAGTVIQLTATVKCSAKSSYTSAAEGTKLTCTYKVISSTRNIAKSSVSLTNAGKEKCAFNNGYEVVLDESDLSVSMDKGKSFLSSDGTQYRIMSIKNNRFLGTATLTLKGEGEYGGTKKFKFKIGKKSIRIKE